MRYKLLVSDLDDTLVSRDKIITEKTEKAVIDAQKRGVKVALASGRQPYGVLKPAEKLKIREYGGYMICFNGGKIIDSRGKCVYSCHLGNEYFRPVYEIMSRYDINVLVHNDNEIYGDDRINDYSYIEPDALGLSLNVKKDIISAVDWNIHKVLGAGAPLELMKAEKDLKKQFGDVLDIYLSAPWFLEVMPKGADKGTGLEKAAQLLGISVSDTVACGDSFNDIPMIKKAGLGVAMKNAEDMLKKDADYITENDCDHDGIAEVIEKFF